MQTLAVLGQDIRQAWRSWRAQPLLSALIVLTLALGTGANVAVFSLVQTVLFRSFPVERPESLVRIYNTGERGGPDSWSLSLPTFRDYRDHGEGFSGVAAYSRDRIPVHLATEGSAPQRVRARVVSGGFFKVLGVGSEAGRVLSPEDDALGAAPVVVLSTALARQLFGAEGAAVGETVHLNGQGFTVVGVAAKGFGGLDPGPADALWLPISWAGTAEPMWATQLDFRSSSFFQVLGRLESGVSPESAQARLESLTVRLRERGPTRPEEEGFVEPWPRLVPLRETVHPKSLRISYLLMGTVLLVLLVACADVAGYLLAKSERDARQVAVRLALGSTRGRIVRQLLVEGLSYALAAAPLGIVMGVWMARLLVRWAPTGLPLPLDPDLEFLDPGLLAFTAGVAVVVSVLIALAPAARVSSGELLRVITTDVGTVGLGGARVPLRSILVVVQVAVSVILITGAGLLLRTVSNLSEVDLGLDPEHVLTASVDVARQGYDATAGQSVLERLRERAASLPGVRSAVLSSPQPLPPSQTMMLTAPAGGNETEVWVGHVLVSPGYFRALGIDLLQGRDFRVEDRTGTPVAIVNSALAHRFWPGRSAVGQRLGGIGPDETIVIVVGVVHDTGERGFAPDTAQGREPVLYLPFAQFYDAFPWQPPSTALLLRTEGNLDAVVPSLVAAAQRVDPYLPLGRVESLRAHLAGPVALQRFLSLVLLVQAGLTLLLAGVGLHGLLAYTTARRGRELAVRIALGAEPKDLRRLVYAKSLGLVATGLVAGLILSFFLGRALSGLLFGVGPIDPVVSGLVVIVVAVLGVVAPSGPLRRVLATDATDSLRTV